MPATQRFVYNIDIIEGCNLRCPSCPVGNMRGIARPKGRMSLDTFERILDKIAVETPVVDYIRLFSWSEPLLHPEIAQFVAAVNRRGWRCYISTNLNRIDRLEEALAAGVYNLRVSLSGFFQETYEQTHEGGDIEVVKTNMRALRAILDKLGAKTRVLVSYHQYRHNMGRDRAEMVKLVEELGFILDPTWAYLMPLEKLFEHQAGKLEGKEKQILPLLVVSPDEHKRIYEGTKHSDCYLRANEMAINADGSVALCCAVYDKKYTVADKFLDVPYEELQRRKYSSEMCGRCMENDFHKVVTCADMDAVDAIARRNLGMSEPWLATVRRVLMRRLRVRYYEAREQLRLNPKLHALKEKVARRVLPQKDA